MEDRSIVEPVRTLLSKKNFNFCEAAAVSVDPVKKTLLCRAADSIHENVLRGGASCPLHTFTLPYDELVIACGAIPNTFNTPGVELHAVRAWRVPNLKLSLFVSQRGRRACAPRFLSLIPPPLTPLSTTALL